MHEFKCPRCGEISYSAAKLDKLRGKNCAECGTEVKEAKQNEESPKLECVR